MLNDTLQYWTNLSNDVLFQMKSTTKLELHSVGAPEFPLSSKPMSSPKLSGTLITCPTPAHGL